MSDLADRLLAYAEQPHDVAGEQDDLRLAASRLREMEWRSIDSAPKDGTWFEAYRPAPAVGTWARIVIIAWNASADDFVWPEEPFDIYENDIDDRTPQGWHRFDVYTSGATFTHWRPLPPPPEGKQ